MAVTGFYSGHKTPSAGANQDISALTRRHFLKVELEEHLQDIMIYSSAVWHEGHLNEQDSDLKGEKTRDQKEAEKCLSEL